MIVEPQDKISTEHCIAVGVEGVVFTSNINLSPFKLKLTERQTCYKKNVLGYHLKLLRVKILVIGGCPLCWFWPVGWG